MRMVIAAIFLVLFSAPQQPATRKSEKTLKTNVAQQKEQAQNCPPIAAQSCPQTPQPQPKSDNSDQEARSRLYTAYLISGPIVVIVTVATLILVWRQIRALHRVERAWLLQSIGSVRHEPHKTGEPLLKAIGVTFQLKNWGNTPGRMTKATAKVITIRDESDLAMLAKSKGDIANELQGRPLAPGEAATLTMVEIAKNTLTEEDWDAVAKEEKVLVFYAEVHYSDIFSKKHVTRFCYRYIKQTWPPRETVEPYGGNKYNRAT
jgi:hypothetical protein